MPHLYSLSHSDADGNEYRSSDNDIGYTVSVGVYDDGRQRTILSVSVESSQEFTCKFVMLTFTETR